MHFLSIFFKKLEYLGDLKNNSWHVPFNKNLNTRNSDIRNTWHRSRQSKKKKRLSELNWGEQTDLDQSPRRGWRQWCFVSRPGCLPRAGSSPRTWGCVSCNFRRRISSDRSGVWTSCSPWPLPVWEPPRRESGTRRRRNAPKCIGDRACPLVFPLQPDRNWNNVKSNSSSSVS